MKLGITSRLSAGILTAVVFVTLIIVGSFSLNTKNLNEANSKDLLDNVAKEVASNVTAKLNVDFGHTRLLALSYNVFQNYEPEELKKVIFPILQRSLENNPDALAYWISLELKEIDPENRNKPDRVTWLADRLTGKIDLRDEVRNQDGKSESPQYLVIKGTKKETLIDPYWYKKPMENDSLLEATVGVPVMKGNRVIGLAGIDFTLNSFDGLLENKDRPFNCSTYFISNDGTLINTVGKAKGGQRIIDIELFSTFTEEIRNNVIAGIPYSGEVLMPEGRAYVTVSPVTMGESINPWAICIVAPISELNKAAIKPFINSLILGLAGILVLAILIFYLINPLMRPIMETTKVLNDVSQGRIDNLKRLKSHEKHELGIMAGAVNRMQERFQAIAGFAAEIGKGNLEAVYPFDTEKDNLGKALEQMQVDLLSLRKETERKDWLKQGINGLNELVKGDRDLADLSKIIIQYLAKYLSVPIGAIYIISERTNTLKLGAGYAFSKRKELNQSIKIGEGLVGQCAAEKEKIILTKIPEDYFPVKSATGSASPSEIIVLPCLFNETLVAVVELGSLDSFSKDQVEFLEAVSGNIAISIQSIGAREEMTILLAKTLEQKEELQAQEEELREANQSLEKQSEELRKSEASLQAQQEELSVTNQELEKNAQMLEEQSERIAEKNRDLEVASGEIERKAKDLEVASKYKSEFLANMSHELRTPLNSMLILSQSLAENSSGRLSADEVESAQIIYRSGNDLHNLINEIMDLSKIEAGKMTINPDKVEIRTIAENMSSLYKPAAAAKNLEWNVTMDPMAPRIITTDQQRVEQIIKNLVSNALKFTSRGSVSINFKATPSVYKYLNKELSKSPTLTIDVSDTGIGIPEDKQAAIFEAFQQADGSTSRKYGGTGLGLSISRQLAKLLGGEINLSSTPGQGSVFTLILPADVNQDPPQVETSPTPVVYPVTEVPIQVNPILSTAPEGDEVPFIPDDREDIKPGDGLILVIEDDPEFSKILLKECHKQQFKCIVAGTGEAGFQLAKQYMPSAIILDIKLPGMDGWRVLDAVKRDPSIRHIPVHMMSSLEETLDAYQKGAIGYLQKPVTSKSLTGAFEKIEHFIDRKMKRMLIVEDNENMRKTIRQLLKGADVEIIEVSTADQCLKLLVVEEFDCMVLDLGLPDKNGFDLLREIRDLHLEHVPPIIVYTGQELTREQNEELNKYTKSIIIKGVKSEERLLDEATLFLHRMVQDLPKQQQTIIKKLYETEDVFSDKQLLLVDDDMRNIFALSKVFEEKGIRVLKASNGKKAIEVLNDLQAIDVILMDIMMPEMDGYEAMQEIRKIDRFKNTPIIALTAKAMKEDRQKCLDSGASDYISKPIDITKLISLLRVWMNK